MTRKYDINIIQASIESLSKLSTCKDDKNKVICNGYTKYEVSNMIRNFCVSASVNKKNQSLLMGLLNTLAPTVDWPLSKSIKNKEVNYESKIYDYIQTDYRTMSFQICPAFNLNCTVFVDQYKDLHFCPDCKSPRFKVCSRCNKDQNCNHKIESRTPHQRIYYRSLYLLMYDILSNFSDSFINYLNYKCKDNENYKYSDVQTGQNFKKHMISMNEKFNEFQNSDSPNAKKVKMINICLSEFYDGIQIRKTKIQTFWPLLVTILNFPPDIRNKLGIAIGMFVMSIFTASQNTDSEIFIL